MLPPARIARDVGARSPTLAQIRLTSLSREGSRDGKLKRHYLCHKTTVDGHPAELPRKCQGYACCGKASTRCLGGDLPLPAISLKRSNQWARDLRSFVLTYFIKMPIITIMINLVIYFCCACCKGGLSWASSSAFRVT